MQTTIILTSLLGVVLATTASIGARTGSAITAVVDRRR